MARVRRAGVFGFLSAAISFSSFATLASSASIPRTFFAELVDADPEVVDRGERLLPAGELGEALERLLAGVGEPGHEVLVGGRLGLLGRRHVRSHTTPWTALPWPSALTRSARR